MNFHDESSPTNFPAHEDNPLNTAIDLRVNMTRRSFFGLAAVVGTLHFLGSAFGGRVTAWADDNETPFFVVTILNPDDIAVFCIDVSQTEKITPVTGAHAKVTSLYNGKVTEGDTDEFGRLVLNVRQLSEQCEESEPDRFTFFGSAEISKAGYRSVAFERRFIQAGAQADNTAHITAPTQPFDEAKDTAYLRMASYQTNDVQYSSLQYPKFPGNTYEQTFKFQVAPVKGKSVTCTLLADGKDVGQATATGDGEGIATCLMKGTWIKDLPVGTSFSVQFAVGTFRKEAALKLNFVSPRSRANAPFQTNNGLLSPGAGIGLAPSKTEESQESPTVDRSKVTLPDTPFANNAVLMADLPWMPITFCSDSAGGAGICFTIKPFSIYNKDNGWFDNTGWTNWGQDANWAKWLEGYEKGKDDAYKRYEKAKALGSGLQKGKSPVFSSADATLTFMLSAMLYPTTAEELAQGKPDLLDGTLKGAVEFYFTCQKGAQFQAGPVPMYICGDFSVCTTFSFQGGLVYNRDTGKIERWFYSATGSKGQGGTIIELTFDMGFSWGIGIKGIVSAGVRGYVNIPVVFSFALPESAKDKPFPHSTGKICLGAQVFVQVLFFTGRYTFIKTGNITLWDNWKSTSNEEAISLLPDDDQGELVLVSDDALMSESYDLYEEDSDLVQASNEFATTTLDALGNEADYNTSKLYALLGNLTDTNRMLGRPYFIDPYTSDIEYDVRKGIKPTIDQVIAQKAFSDPRFKVVYLDDSVYYCRIVTVIVTLDNSLTPDFRVVAVPVEEGSDEHLYFFVPDATIAAASTYLETGDLAEAKNLLSATVANSNATFARLKADLADVALGDDPFDYPDSLVNGSTAMATIPVPVYANETNMTTESLRSEYLERAETLSTLLNGSQDIEWVAELMSEGVIDANVKPTNGLQVPRTRIVITPFNTSTRSFGTDTVLNFVIPSQSAKTNRNNINDVDFEVLPDESGNALYFGVVSTARTINPRKTLESQKEGLFSSIFKYTPSTNTVSDVRTNLFDFSKQEGEFEWKAIPMLVPGKAGGQLGLTCASKRGDDYAFTLHYYPKDANDIYEGDSVPPNTHFIIPHDTQKINGDGHLMAYTSPTLKSGDAEAVILSWQYNESIGTQKHDEQGRAIINERAAIWSFSSANMASSVPDEQRILYHEEFTGAQNLTLLGDEKGFAYVAPIGEARNHLQIVNLNFPPGNPAGQLTRTCIGVTDTGQFFCAPGGNMLYTQRIMDGRSATAEQDFIEAALDSEVTVCANQAGCAPQTASIEYMAANDHDTENGPVVKQYQTMACRWDPIYKRYRQFFPYAQLRSAPDESGLYMTKHGTAFMYSTILNINTQKANVSYAEVPYVMGLQLESAQCVDSFIAANKKSTIHPELKVTNTGNLPVRGFTMHVFLDGKEIGSGTKVDRLEDIVAKHEGGTKMKQDIYALIEENAPQELIDAATALADSNDPWGKDEEAILWPGSTRTYAVPWETPDTWERGTKKLTVSISDPLAPIFNSSEDEGALQEGGTAFSALFEDENDETILTLCNESRSWDFEIFMDTVDCYEDSLGPCYYTDSTNSEKAAARTGDHVGAIAAVAGAAAALGAAGMGISKTLDKDEE